MTQNIKKEEINDTLKKIAIDGTSTRYQLRKLIEEKQVHKRKTLEKIDLVKYTHEIQTQLVSKLKDETSNSEKKDDLLLIKEIKNKLANYKQQDSLKKIFSEKEFVSLDFVILLLDSSKLQCHYCSQNIYILYEIVREQMQWTLDRINNDQGHNIGNVLISCLQCNLKRRRTSKDAFMFTKNVRIIKNDSI